MNFSIKHLLGSIPICLALLSQTGYAQTSEPTTNWDNQSYLINKVAWGKEQWRFSGELQTRFKNHLTELQQWQLEAVATYMPSEKWEVVPDFRFTVTPSSVEYRPGLGIIYKNLFTKSQLVHQVKWQWDKESTGYSSHGLRYAIFYNYLFSEKFLGSALAGGLFEFGERFTDFLGVRAGLSLAYIFDETNTINLGYFYGAVNNGTSYENIGIIALGFIINLQKKFDHVPAKYISF
jgi:hypothetical protein